eukprot:CAMPEP_0174954748 /NCGR_PEP_ID=MMETSP0004_2-20121128/599_1 /TAXON_ID=420556 /ORGANISM="Ochromonas sp., Strain CCMP1393" /LENGTH=1315 /DNA_ID=CAMNT_0016202601 /DNA_START=234 /DNA_END=4178 /DNA_ORIENTATION=-
MTQLSTQIENLSSIDERGGSEKIDKQDEIRDDQAVNNDTISGENGIGIPYDAVDDSGNSIELPDMWEESGSNDEEHIDFIFCHRDTIEEYEYDMENMYNALTFCRTSLKQLRPIIVAAADYTADKVRMASQSLLRRTLTADAYPGQSLSQQRTNIVVRAGMNVHQAILFLCRNLDTAALRKTITTTSGVVISLRDVAVLRIASYIRSNVYLSSFMGCVHESTLFMVDRLRSGVELYAHFLQSDDPENVHMDALRDGGDWRKLLLKCSMTSLTWKQRQLLEETRDGGNLTASDYQKLVQAQVALYDKERITQVASEYFYMQEDVPHNEEQSHKHFSTSQRMHDSANMPTDLTMECMNNISHNHTPINTGELISYAHHIESIHAQDKKLNDIGEYDGSDNRDIYEHNDNCRDSAVKESGDSFGQSGGSSSQALHVLKSNIHSVLVEEAALGDEDAQYALARFFTPPTFQESPCCAVCHSTFSITLFRHHCRFCGRSVCDAHANGRRSIYRYGMVHPVRVCANCQEAIDDNNHVDDLIWKDMRISAYPTVDRGVDKVLRIADYSIKVAQNALTYNFPAKLALDTVEVLKRYGLTGFTGLLLRQDFLESVETLKRISGMESMFSLSLHELTACVYYKLAVERGLRGCHPNAEYLAHRPTCLPTRDGLVATVRLQQPSNLTSASESSGRSGHLEHESHGGDESNNSNNKIKNSSSASGQSSAPSMDRTNCEHTSSDIPPYTCFDASDADLDLAIRLAPLALTIIYEENPVDSQRLAKLQGWTTLFTNAESNLAPEQPCYTLFGSAVVTSANAHDEAIDTTRTREHSGEYNEDKCTGEKKEAVLIIRGTQTIQDVVTDIRAAPQIFPPNRSEITRALRGNNQVYRGRRKGDNNRELHPYSSVDYAEPSSPSIPAVDQATPSLPPQQQQTSQWDWLAVPEHNTYACGGMVRAAMYMLREVGPALRRLHAQGYRILIAGHSLGGAVAALLVYLLRMAIPNIQGVTYGCPSCMDAETADILRPYVISVVMHDDVISRITPQSIRMLMRELMVFKDQMFLHLQQEWYDVLLRAASVWSPRWRSSSSTSSHTPASTTTSASATVAASARVVSPPRSVCKASASSSCSPLEEDDNARDYTSTPFVGCTPIDAGEVGISDSSSSSSSPLKDTAAVLVEDEPLTQLWLPGRIIHIYIYSGRCHAAEVSRTFPDLRSIVLQGNIFEDHRGERISNALLEVRAVRQAVSAVSTRRKRLQSQEKCELHLNSFGIDNVVNDTRGDGTGCSDMNATNNNHNHIHNDNDNDNTTRNSNKHNHDHHHAVGDLQPVW